MSEAESTRRSGSGAMRRRALATAGGFADPYDDDPMSRVLALDSQASGPVAWLGYGLGAIALMLGLMNGVRLVTLILAMTDHLPSQVSAPQEVDVMKEEAPPPAAQAEPDPRHEPAPAHPKSHEPPPPPAQAGKVLTQEPDPNDPVDLTGNTIVTGNADAYAGGTTAANGTSPTAVWGLAIPGGVPGGTGQRPAPASGTDHTRAASLGGGAEWSCPFPPEADTVQIDEAYVMLQVDVRADGSAGAVRVLSDPGNGFGREARRCATAKRFQTALDRDGNPLPGATKPFRVHFSR